MKNAPHESRQPTEHIDWRLTTWEGSRRAQLRQWRRLTLRERLSALDEMSALAERFARIRDGGN